MATKNSINSLTSAAEVNILDGATLSTTELNLLDLAGLTAGWVLSADTATTASWKAPTGGGGGEANTISSLGGGLDIQAGKSGVDLRINTLLASDFDVAANVISIDYTNGQAASGSTKGFLIAADWTTFNNKLATNGNGSALTGLTATQVGLGNVTNESKATMFTNAVFTGTFTAPNTTITNAMLAGSIDLTTKVTGILSSTNGGTGINNGGRTLTLNTNSGTLAFSAASKTLTIANTLTLSGTDASTLNIGAGGTLGTAAFTAATAYAASGLATASGLTMSTARILGRTTGTTGAIEEISVGATLSLAATVLGVVSSPILTTARTISGTGEAAFTTTAFDGSAAVSGAVTLTNSAVIGKVLTGYVSGAGTVAATDTILQAIQKLNGNDALKAPLASPTFTGTVTLPAGQIVNGVTLTTAGGTTNFLRADGTYAAPSVAGSALTGTSLAAGIVTSSLTTVGTLTSGTLSTGFVLGGVTVTLGSDATGDVWYRNAGGLFTRLGIGTANQVLTVSGGLPSWQNNPAGFADPMTTRGDIIYKNASNTTTRLGRGTANQVLTSDGTDIAWATPAGGGGGMTWTEVTGTTQAMSVDNGYIANNVAQVVFTLPATAAVGKVVAVTGKGAGGWRISQNASGKIHFGNVDSLTGTGGYITSNLRYDCVELLCTVADNEWTVRSSVGNIVVNIS